MTCVGGCSRVSVCMRLTSLLVPMPTLMMSSNNPVHRYLKSAVQIVAMSPSAPSAARILAVIVLPSVVVACVVGGCFDDDAPFCRHEEVIAYSAGPQPASLRFLDFDDGLPFWSVFFADVVGC